MGSSTKRRTTMAKLQRENRLADKRMDKEARKRARRAQAATGGEAQVDERARPSADPDA